LKANHPANILFVNGFSGNDLLKIAGKPGLQLTYETTFGTKYILEFQWNDETSQTVNQRLVGSAISNSPPTRPWYQPSDANALKLYSADLK